MRLQLWSRLPTLFRAPSELQDNELYQPKPLSLDLPKIRTVPATSLDLTPRIGNLVGGFSNRRLGRNNALYKVYDPLSNIYYYVFPSVGYETNILNDLAKRVEEAVMIVVRIDVASFTRARLVTALDSYSL